MLPLRDARTALAAIALELTKRKDGLVDLFRPSAPRFLDADRKRQ